eukprot:gnl/Dysnectes_brevis/2764_a3367_782.p1 GENE.gnl/Dysnectes_brevis/2764_a3367_782~~gnl/Dysnectes_brevis/2764_a3367_782.p1  ORF type:complete len:405 (-),score=183.25 gnl/Dysnectes_brevis/2764_a3367_782:46-1260(-)
MEFAEGGTLRDLVLRGPIPEDRVWSLSIQICLGLLSLHSMRIIHRDIKTLNIFLDRTGKVKIGDLGVAKQLGSASVCARTLVGSPYYLSPELCRNEPYNSKSDIWALGVTIYELITGGKHPFSASNQAALILKIVRGKYPRPRCGRAMRDLIAWCLQMDPRARPNAARVLSAPGVHRRAQTLRLEITPAMKALIDQAASGDKPTPVVAEKRPPSTMVSQKRIVVAFDPRGGDASVSTPQTPAEKLPKEPGTAALSSVDVSLTPAANSSLVMAQTSVEEYLQEEFEESSEPEKSADTSPSPAATDEENGLNVLLDREQKLTARLSTLREALEGHGLPQAVLDELVDFYTTGKAASASEEEIHRFVFGRLSYTQVGVTTELMGYASLFNEREAVTAQITELISEMR